MYERVDSRTEALLQKKEDEQVSSRAVAKIKPTLAAARSATSDKLNSEQN